MIMIITIGRKGFMRYSKQRNIILSIVRASEEHPTAEQVYIEAKKLMPTIGIATVYRNLRALVDSGEIRGISANGDSERFDGRMGVHYHMRCRECGALTDIFPTSEEKLALAKANVLETFGLPVGDVDFNTVVIDCICDKCSAIKMSGQEEKKDEGFKRN